MIDIIIIILMPFLITFAYAGLRGAPFVPTRKHDVERFSALADVKPGDVFYDLGCGDGRLVQAAAKAGAKAFGYEISLIPYIMAKIRLAKYKNAKVFFKDFWNQNLSDADIVYIFLMPKHYFKYKEKMEKELKPGAKIITYVWPIKEWKAVKIDEKKDFPKMYLYKARKI